MYHNVFTFFSPQKAQEAEEAQQALLVEKLMDRIRITQREKNKTK